MPTHIETVLVITGNKESINALLKNHCSKVECAMDEYIPRKVDIFDFNTIIPMPESLRITSSSHVDKAIAYIQATERNDVSFLNQYRTVSMRDISNEDLLAQFKAQLSVKDLEEGYKSIYNLKQYGHKDWYSWQKKNWGVKWGAYNCTVTRVDDNTLKIHYYTAWTVATLILNKLHEMYNDLIFEQIALDEFCTFGIEQKWNQNGYAEEHFDDGKQFAKDRFGYTFEEDISE